MIPITRFSFYFIFSSSLIFSLHIFYKHEHTYAQSHVQSHKHTHHHNQTLGSSKRSSGTYVLDTYATLAVSLAEKQKTSEAFCMILLKRCLHLIAPFTPNNEWSVQQFDPAKKDPKGLPSLNENCRIVTFMLIHRQALFENLFSGNHSISNQNQTHNREQNQGSNSIQRQGQGQGRGQGQGQGQGQIKGRGDSIHKEEDSAEDARIEAGRFLLNGLQLLLPRDGNFLKYDLHLQGKGGNEDGGERQKREEFERVARFCAWFSSNRTHVN